MNEINILQDEAIKLCEFINSHKGQSIKIKGQPLLGMGYMLTVESENGDKKDITTDDITNF